MMSSQIVPEGYKQTKVGVIPDDWKEYLFNDIFIFSTGKNIKQDEASVKYNIPCVRYGELYHMYNEVINNVINKTNLDKSELLFSKGDEILLPSAGEDPLDIGSASALTLENIAIGRTINILRPIKNNIYSQKYVAYYINQQLKKKISTLAKGSSISNVYNSDLKKLRINLPPIKEQEKIAEILTTWDDAISIQNELIKAKEELKKGLMQKLLSGNVRFEGFDGEWEDIPLSDFLMPISREVDKPASNYLAIGIRSHCKGTFQKQDSNPNKIAMDKLYQVKENDLIVNITFAWEGAIAIVKKEDENGLVSHRFPIYNFHKDLAIYEFFQYIFIQKKFRFMLDLISPGGAGRNRVMSKKEFLKLKWKMPSVEEQEKIAEVLTNADKEINLLKNELEELKEQKKGLMQKLLTGKVRVEI